MRRIPPKFPFFFFYWLGSRVVCTRCTHARQSDTQKVWRLFHCLLFGEVAACRLIAVSTFWRRTSWWTTERPFASPLSRALTCTRITIACYTISLFLYHKLKGGWGVRCLNCNRLWFPFESRERLIMLIELSGKSWLESRLWLYSFFQFRIKRCRISIWMSAFSPETATGCQRPISSTWLFLSAFQMYAAQLFL